MSGVVRYDLRVTFFLFLTLSLLCEFLLPFGSNTLHSNTLVQWMVPSRKRSEGRPKARQVLGKFGKWLFLILIVGQNCPSVSSAAEGQQRRTEAVMRMQQEVQVKEYRWAEETSQSWRQPKGEDGTEMKQEARVLRSTWLSGSGWSTEKEYMMRYKGKCGLFFWEGAQIEEGGNGAAVQQRSQGRMEICSR